MNKKEELPCYFCNNNNATQIVKNKLGYKFNVCDEHRIWALSRGYELLSTQPSKQLDKLYRCVCKPPVAIIDGICVKCGRSPLFPE